MNDRSRAGHELQYGECARRGEGREIASVKIRSNVVAGTSYDVVAIEIENGAYEVMQDRMRAATPLAARVHGTQTWVRRGCFP